MTDNIEKPKVKLVKYPKVLRINSRGIEKLFEGPVEITEKLDGSQWRIKVSKDGTWDVGTKGVSGKDNIAKDFKPATDISEKLVKKARDLLFSKFPESDDAILFMEYLRSEKHNTLQYTSCPVGGFYLFGITMIDSNENFVNLQRKDLIEVAEHLEIESPKVLYEGEIDPQKLEDFLVNDSFLGGCKPEGIVIKNYNQTYPIDLISTSNWVGFPLIGKLVREEFTELNEKEWKTKRDPISSALTPARFDKVLQHLKEGGIELTGEARDLQHIAPAFAKDVMDEEFENFKKVWIDRLRKDLRGRASKYAQREYLERLRKGGVETVK